MDSQKKTRRYKYVEKANHMLNQNLDITDLLKSTQLNKLLLSALIKPEQRLLMLYQRK